MKKSVLFLLFFSVFIILGIFLSVFLPQINIEITIQPQYQSFVNAHEADSEATEKPHCVVFSDYDIDKVIENINSSYDKSYRLKGFAANSNIKLPRYFAAVCKE